MNRTVRRSMRLAKNNRRKRRNRSAAKRLRSPIERNRDRMSVGEVMGLSPAASYAVNLSECQRPAPWTVRGLQRPMWGPVRVLVKDRGPY